MKVTAIKNLGKTDEEVYSPTLPTQLEVLSFANSVQVRSVVLNLADGSRIVYNISWDS